MLLHHDTIARVAVPMAMGIYAYSSVPPNTLPSVPGMMQQRLQQRASLASTARHGCSLLGAHQDHRVHQQRPPAAAHVPCPHSRLLQTDDPGALGHGQVLAAAARPQAATPLAHAAHRTTRCFGLAAASQLPRRCHSVAAARGSCTLGWYAQAGRAAERALRRRNCSRRKAPARQAARAQTPQHAVAPPVVLVLRQPNLLAPERALAFELAAGSQSQGWHSRAEQAAWGFETATDGHCSV
jgi:hypothetical protein